MPRGVPRTPQNVMRYKLKNYSSNLSPILESPGSSPAATVVLGEAPIKNESSTRIIKPKPTYCKKDGKTLTKDLTQQVEPQNFEEWIQKITINANTKGNQTALPTPTPVLSKRKQKIQESRRKRARLAHPEPSTSSSKKEY
ncbi:hypothetical protein CROQUDRAFT_677988 [Cronartium quercuum f. sp. fusiforme G11]|uniref:Uncharacterized protein n=1 Tax=Cronartium quercuum f. sp. fusiforme G11 TaxID=708437 RepID=A0A9P6NUF7_9BASI|nr:hypothetical protein CROQUDRAFT_677988 [Cronartium quercuum f. sp. fusiforme G11]